MSERRTKYKPVPLLVTPERVAEPSHRPASATVVSPTSKPSLDHTHSLSLSECSSPSSFLSQDQPHADTLVTEPQLAATLANTSPIKIIKHDVSDSVQSKSSSGVVTVVQSASAAANDSKGDHDFDNTLLDETFHTFCDDNQFDRKDDNFAYRFSTNFISPPLKKEDKLRSGPPQINNTSHINPAGNQTGKSKQSQECYQPSSAISSSSDVTSAPTVESHSLTELATLMNSVGSEMAEKSVLDTRKQEKRRSTRKDLFAKPVDRDVKKQSLSLLAASLDATKSSAGHMTTSVKEKKKQKKGRIISSRYMAPVRTKQVADTATVRPSNSRVAMTTFTGQTASKKSVWGPSQHVRQQLVLDATLPTPTSFRPSDMVSSTPATMEGTSYDIGAVHDGSYIAAAPKVATSGKASTNISRKASHHMSTVGADKQRRQEFKALRACALQWAYISAKIARNFGQQEEQAKAQLHELYSQLVKNMEENATLENDIATIQHQMTVDSTLHSQLQGLGAVVAHLPEVEPQYRIMTQSLDNSRHLMRTNGVIVPSEDELLVKLAGSDEVVEEISFMIGPKASQVATLAETRTAVQDLKVGMQRESESLEEVTQEMESLTLEETSLQYHVDLLKEVYIDESEI